MNFQRAKSGSFAISDWPIFTTQHRFLIDFKSWLFLHVCIFYGIVIENTCSNNQIVKVKIYSQSTLKTIIEKCQYVQSQKKDDRTMPMTLSLASFIVYPESATEGVM